MLRWQQTPPQMDTSGLIREVRPVRLSELSAKLKSGLWVTPEERAEALEARAAAYDLRFQIW